MFCNTNCGLDGNIQPWVRQKDLGFIWFRQRAVSAKSFKNSYLKLYSKVLGNTNDVLMIMEADTIQISLQAKSMLRFFKACPSTCS